MVVWCTHFQVFGVVFGETIHWRFHSESRDPFSVLDLSCFFCILPELYYLFDLDFQMYSYVDVSSVLELDFVSL